VVCYANAWIDSRLMNIEWRDDQQGEAMFKNDQHHRGGGYMC